MNGEVRMSRGQLSGDMKSKIGSKHRYESSKNDSPRHTNLCNVPMYEVSGCVPHS